MMPPESSPHGLEFDGIGSPRLRLQTRPQRDGNLRAPFVLFSIWAAVTRPPSSFIYS